MIHQSEVVTWRERFERMLRLVVVQREPTEPAMRLVDEPDVAGPTFVNGRFDSRSSSHSWWRSEPE
jgi:hypothetical protein